MKTPHIYFLLLPIAFVTLSGCTPEPSEAQEFSLEEYMQLDSSAQNEFIFDIQDKIFQELAESLRGELRNLTEVGDSQLEQVERAECVGDLFSNDTAGIHRFNQVKGTLADAANKKVEKSADELAGLVIKHFCP